jgi:hypothetical protein
MTTFEGKPDRMGRIIFRLDSGTYEENGAGGGLTEVEGVDGKDG